VELRLKYPPVPEHAADLAETCVAAANQISGLVLDYSPGSLDLVDRQMDTFAADGHDSSVLASTLFAFGCYVGEVLVRNLGGRWVSVEKPVMKDRAGFPMVVMMDSGDWWNPIGKVFKRLDDGPSESISYFYAVAAQAAARAGRAGP
jgi:hypothetical protein